MRNILFLLFLLAGTTCFAEDSYISNVNDSGRLVIATYGSGTAYSLTNSQALIDLGTTDPTIIITKPGMYMITGRITVKYNATTFAANQTLTVKLRRTNNTAADLSNSSTVLTLRILTTTTDCVGTYHLPFVFYTTLNTDDSISLYGALSAAPGAGSVDVTEADIEAVRLY